MTDTEIQALLRAHGHRGDAFDIAHCRRMGLSLRFSPDELSALLIAQAAQVEQLKNENKELLARVAPLNVCVDGQELPQSGDGEQSSLPSGPDVVCEECGHIFTALEVEAEDKKAWGHPCRNQYTTRPVSACESYRPPVITGSAGMKDPQPRFMLNQYGRQCFDLGYEAAKAHFQPQLAAQAAQLETVRQLVTNWRDVAVAAEHRGGNASTLWQCADELDEVLAHTFPPPDGEP